MSGSASASRLLLVGMLAGCGPVAPPRERPDPPIAFDPRLTVPPTPESATALTQASPAQRAYYLVDLFDGARLLGDAASREQLWSAVGRPSGTGRGEGATREALQAMADGAEKSGASTLAQLLDDDLEELDGGDALSVAARRRRIGRSDDPAAGHALLSLYAACVRSLGDAATTVPWRRAEIADRCLYSLFEADPEPYFRREPSERPPDPPWSRLFAGLDRLSAATRARAPRLGTLLDRLDADRRALADKIEVEGIAPPDLERLARALPVGDASLPSYDRAPWVVVENEMAVVGRARFTTRDHLLVERIDEALTVQRVTGTRGRVALFIPESGSADAIDSLGALAKRGGAETVELVLAAPLTLKAPAGDVWSEGPPPSVRFAVLPLQLRPASGRDLPHEVSAHAVTVTLLVAPEGITAFSSDGTIDLGPVTALPERLAELRRAFPDEPQIALAIDPTASYHDVVVAARAARSAFRQVALVDVPRRNFKEGFAARVLRRSTARLELHGDGVIEKRSSVLRGCYLDALDRDPALAGSIVVLPGSPPSLKEGGPGDPQLRDCLVHRAAALGSKSQFTVEMAVR
jgi:hypothetical protein